MINVQCEVEGCGQDFGISFSDVDEYKQAGKQFLCPRCEAKVTEAEIVEEPKRRFEYRTCHLSELDKLGYDGWEAIATLVDNVILLKQEYFE